MIMLFENVFPFVVPSSLLLLGLSCYIFLKRNQILKYRYDSLSSSYDRLNSIFSFSCNHWFLWNSITNDIKYSSSLTKFLEYKGEEKFRFHHFLELLESEDLQQIESFTQRDVVEHTEIMKQITLKNEVCFYMTLKCVNGGEYLFWIHDQTEFNNLINKKIEILQQEIKTLKRYLDFLPMPIWSQNEKGKISYCNEYYSKILSQDPHDVLRKQFQVVSLQEKSIDLEDMETIRNEKKYVIYNGRRRLIEFHMSSTKQELLGHGIDLTLLEDSKKDLNRYVKSYEEVLDNLTAGVSIYNGEKNLIFHNHAYCRMFSLDQKWLTQEPAFNQVLTELRDRRQLPEMVDFSEYKSNKVQDFTTLTSPFQELEHLPDGRTLRKITSPHPLGGVFQVYEDLTDRFDLERKTNTLIAVQEQILNQLQIGIIVFSTGNNLKFINATIRKLWNVEESEVSKGMHLSKVVSLVYNSFDTVKSLEECQNSIIKIINQRNSTSLSIHKKDKKTLFLSYIPLPNGDNLFSFSDITDTINVSKAYQEKSYALEVADRLKSRFVTNISYDLRTPLNSIIGYGNIILNQYFGNLDKTQKEYLEKILTSSHHLLSLVNNIFDVAQIEAGKMTFYPTMVDIHQLLEEVVDQSSRKEKDIDIDLICSRDIGNILIDRKRIFQALLHLLKNANKYNLSQKQIVLEALLKNKYLVISVISFCKHEKVEKEMESFIKSIGVQSINSLDIPIVKSFVELHGGKIEIANKGNNTIKVSCYIPIKQEKKVITKKTSSKIITLH